MNDERDPTLDEAAMGELLESAGRRPAVPAEDLAAVRAAAREEWRRVVREGTVVRPAWRRRFLPLMLAAASLLAVLVLGFWWRLERPPVAPAPAAALAQVELVHGEVQAEGPAGALHPLAVGEALVPGTRVSIAAGAPGAVALRWMGGESVRLGAGTRAALVSPERIDLKTGTVYVDVGARAGGGALTVETPFGEVREIGTQFEVRVGERGAEPDAALLRIRVREGAVALVRGASSEAVERGGELRVRQDGSLARAELDPQGPEWDWILAAAPSLAIDGRTLGEYLDWIGRETGWRVRFADDALAGRARAIRLRGAIDGLRPDESLEVVLPGSGLEYTLEAGELLIRSRTRT